MFVPCVDLRRKANATGDDAARRDVTGRMGEDVGKRAARGDGTPRAQRESVAIATNAGVPTLRLRNVTRPPTTFEVVLAREFEQVGATLVNVIDIPDAPLNIRQDVQQSVFALQQCQMAQVASVDHQDVERAEERRRPAEK